MKAIDLYLRPLSDFHTGTLPYVEEKATSVEEIEVERSGIGIQQQGEIPLETPDGIKSQNVPHSDRHWWAVIAKGWFDHLDKPLRHHGDIVDFVTTLNLCTGDPVVFSQSPGRVVSGYHEVDERGRFNYQDHLSAGALGIQSALTKEIPDRVTITGDVPNIYEKVREVRESEAESNPQVDLMIALHMYDDALTATRWTCIANLFYVCENVLCSGFDTSPKQRIAGETDLDYDEAEAWGDMVNRLKHPDTPSDSKEPPATLLEMIDEGASIPTVARMRRAANTVLAASVNG